MNHTVDTDADAEPELNPNMDKPDFAELKSKPSFDVDLQLGDQTLSFTCSFLPSDSVQQSDDYSMYSYYIPVENCRWESDYMDFSVHEFLALFSVSMDLWVP